MRVLRSVETFLVIAAAASVASAEVSDKAATIPQHWLLALPLAVLLFLAASFRWWLGAVLAVVPIFILLGSIDIAFDEYIGPALWSEQGLPYFASLWGSEMNSNFTLSIRYYAVRPTVLVVTTDSHPCRKYSPVVKML